MHWQGTEQVPLEEPSLCLSTVVEQMLIPCVVDQEELRRQKYSFPVSTDGGVVWAWAWRIIALAGYVAILKEMRGPQEWWKCALLTCLPVQSWAGHRQPGQQVAEGLADPTPRISHSSKS